MTDTALLPEEFGRHWVKRLARIMGAPIPTARHWVFVKVPDARLPEIARAIVDECDRLKNIIEETQRRWAEVANEANKANGNENLAGTDMGRAKAR